MRRLVWSVLLTAMAVLALAGTALAADDTAVVNGLTLTKKAGAWQVTAYDNVIKAVVIPSEYEGFQVTEIGANAFAGKGLTSVEIPETVKSIGRQAFANCASLNSVTFLDSAKAAPVSAVTEIGESAFASCGALKKLNLSNNVKTIGKNAFTACGQLAEVVILDGTTKIEAGAFSSCANLARVVVCGDSVQTTVASGAFVPSTKLKVLHCQGSQVTFEGDADANPWKDTALHTDTSVLNLVTDATCRNAGSFTTIVTCGKNCKFDGVKLTTATLPHNWGLETSEEDPANHKECQSYKITKTRSCQNAGCTAQDVQVETVQSTKEHNWEEKTETTKEATCKTAGVKATLDRCTVCGTETVKKTEPIPINPDAHEYEERTITTAPTCGEPGYEKVVKVCKLCGNEEEVSKTETDPATGSHDWEAAKYIVREGDEATCTKEGKETLVKLCRVCSAEAPESEYTDAEQAMEKTKTIDVLPHDWEGGEETITKAATCTATGVKTIADRTCKNCGTTDLEHTEEIPMTDHVLAAGEEKIKKAATCTESGLKDTGVQKCKNCSYEKAAQENVAIPPLGHQWGNFTAKTGEGARQEPTCGVAGWVLGTVSCTREGCTASAQDHKLEIEPTGLHEYGEWTVTEEATGSEDGSRERVCKICEYKDTQTLPAGNVPDKPADSSNPSNPDESADPDKPAESETPKTYQVDIIQGSNGSASANRSTAQSGERVTITATPASGYELDMLRVISADGKVLSLDSLGGGQYRFTMPAANVEVRATFSRKSSSSWSGSNWASAPGEGTNGDARRTTDVMPTQNPTQSVPKAGAYEQLFRDIPTNHWAAGEINWANQMGYMNGTAGRFNPDGTITHQQMWMVLARLTGNHPANMTEARRWAVEHSFADGSAPTAAVSRHQLVTALYRSAHLMGSTNRNTTSLAGYADSRTVPAVARDAFSWAVANGIVSGTASGRLDPDGTVTRAQFAVILYRYSQRV